MPDYGSIAFSLASSRNTTPVAQNLREILVFELAGHRFGLPGSTVRELLRAVFIHPLPRSPKTVEGVINVRGEVVPVFDLRQALGLPYKPVEPGDHFVVVWAGARLAALRVDRAVELATVEASAVEKRAELPAQGVAKFADGLVVLPDVHSLLAEEGSLNLAGVSCEAFPPEGKELRDEPAPRSRESQR